MACAASAISTATVATVRRLAREPTVSHTAAARPAAPVAAAPTTPAPAPAVPAAPPTKDQRLAALLLKYQTDQITQFALVPSLTSCCYGAPPQAQHTIMVTCPANSAATYSADLVVVQGLLKVEEKREEGYTISLFEVAAESVKPSDTPMTPDVLNGKKQAQPGLGSVK